MPKFGADVTSMSPVQVKPFIAPGVEDNSAAYGIGANTSLLTGAAKMGLAAAEGYSVAEAKGGLRKEWEEYSATSPSIFATEQETLDRQRTNLASEGKVEEARAIMDKQKANLAKSRNALTQGVMSEAEFVMKTTAATRAAVTSNPFFSKELIRGLQEEYELLGISSTLAADRAINKSKSDVMDSAWKNTRDEADKRHIPYTYDTPFDVLLESVNKHKEYEAAEHVWTNSQKHYDVNKRDQGIGWVTRNGDKAVIGSLDKFGKSIMDMANVSAADPKAYASIAAQVKLIADQHKNVFLTSIPADLRNEPAVLQRIESYNKGIDNTVSVLEKLGSGSDWKLAMENTLATAKAVREKRIVDTYDTAAIDLMVKIQSATPNAIHLNEDARGLFHDTMAAIASNNHNSPAIDKSLPKDVNDNRLSDHIKSGIKLGQEDNDYTPLEKVLDTYANKTPTITNTGDRQMFLYKNLDTIANSDLQNAPTLIVNKTMVMVDQAMGDPVFGAKSMMENIAKYKPGIQTTADGKLVFTGPHAKAFEDKFGKIYNSALSAFVRVTKSKGGDIEEAKAFNQKYLFSQLPRPAGAK
jgi:hypothetical protein